MLERIREVIDEAIPKEQAGSRRNRICCDQVLALTNHIELEFELKLKTAVVFLDLSAAYDTVWKRGLIFKLSRIIPCRKTLSILVDMLSDQNFRVEINGKSSRKRTMAYRRGQYLLVSCIAFTYQRLTQENSSTLMTMPWPASQKLSKSWKPK